MIIPRDCRRDGDLAQHLSARHQATGRGPHRCRRQISRHRGSSPPHQRRRRAPQPASRPRRTRSPVGVERFDAAPHCLGTSQSHASRIPKGGSASGASHNIVSATSAKRFGFGVCSARTFPGGREPEIGFDPKGFLERIDQGRRSVPHTLLISRDGLTGSPSRSRLREAWPVPIEFDFSRTERYGLECRDLATVLPYITARRSLVVDPWEERESGNAPGHGF